MMAIEFIKEYNIYIYEDHQKPEEDQEVLAYLLDTLVQLGYNPTESLEAFKKWFWRRIKKYDVTPQQLEHCIDNFYDYWSEQSREIKNFKTTFFNNPHLRRYLRWGYESKININNI